MEKKGVHGPLSETKRSKGAKLKMDNKKKRWGTKEYGPLQVSLSVLGREPMGRTT